MNKHQLAFLWSARRLRQTTGKLYFWTFTFKSVYNAWEYQHLWHKFQYDLRHLGTSMLMGLRVVQMHESHGFHYHCLINEWLDARRVWRVARKHGMGMIDAMRVGQSDVDVDKAVNYVSRYLTDRDEKFPIRLRRWGAMFGFPCYAVNNIKMICPASDSLAYISKLCGRGVMKPDLVSTVLNSPNTQHGDYMSLMCAFDLKHFDRVDSFSWRERDMEAVLQISPYCDWVLKDATLFQPILMPDLLGGKSIYWGSNDSENKSRQRNETVVELRQLANGDYEEIIINQNELCQNNQNQQQGKTSELLNGPLQWSLPMTYPPYNRRN